MGHPNYEVTGGSATLDGQDLLALEADERAKAGLFLAFQYPTSIPGVTVANFLRHAVTNVRNPDRKEGEDLIPMREFRKESAPRWTSWGWTPTSPAVPERGLLRRREEAGRGPPTRHAPPAFAILDETDSGLDIDAVRIVSEGVNKVAAKSAPASW